MIQEELRDEKNKVIILVLQEGICTGRKTREDIKLGKIMCFSCMQHNKHEYHTRTYTNTLHHKMRMLQI